MKTTQYKRIMEEILRLIDVGVHVVDANGRTVIYNDAMANLEKMRPRDVLNKPFLEVLAGLTPEDSTLLAALENKKTTKERQQTYKNKDGKEIITVNTTVPVLEEERVIGAIEIAKNVTALQNMTHTILTLQRETRPAGVNKERKIKQYRFDSIIGRNQGFLGVVEKARKAAKSQASVIIYGETGTGKELFAQSIHFDSRRKSKPFLAQNCAALPESLLEGILFGTEKGGFTGAVTRTGLFEQADGGTLLLDELSAMPIELQGKLLRVLQEDYIRPVGGTRDIPVDVRIVATFNEPAEKLMAEGKLRRDLYYRLNIIQLSIPPLRERRDDISLLAERFLDKHNKRNGKEVWMLSEKAKEKLAAYDYPGNVRELENIIAGALSMIEGEHVMTEEHIILPGEEAPDGLETGFCGEGESLREYLSRLEKSAILEAMERFQGNRTKAAQYLGLSRQNLQYKLRNYKNLE